MIISFLIFSYHRQSLLWRVGTLSRFWGGIQFAKYGLFGDLLESFIAKLGFNTPPLAA